MAQDFKENNNISEERAKGPFAHFFISGWNHLVRLMGVNVLFLLFNIPSLAIAFGFSIVFMPGIVSAFNLNKFISITADAGTEVVSYQLLSLLMVFFVISVTASLLICIGPFQTGFAQVYKDIRNGTSVSLFGSFKVGLKENWKKALVSMFIGIFLSAVFILAVSFYLNMKTDLGIVIGTVFCVLYVAFILVQNFAYNLMVTTDLKLGQIYKNSLLFLLIRFGHCLALGIVVILFYILIPFVLLMSASYTTLGIFIFLYSFLVIAWVQYGLSYYTGRLIDRYVAEDEEPSEENSEET
ncbi:MAG: DUF624 domain-containing protein [Clostridiales bacterium]|nr:DUF624 domain-containing protein [Clostridiales bacterium]MBQ2155783.1 DUF624 domain-containing protein [Clostridiales bacterium]